MELKTNSLHVKLYKWFYNLEDSYHPANICTCLPTNICTYFWKYVFLLILLLPAVVLFYPIWTIRQISPNFANAIQVDNRGTGGIGLCAWFILVIITLGLVGTPHLISFIKTDITLDGNFEIIVSIILWLIVLTSLFGLIINGLIRIITSNKNVNIKDTVVYQYVKGKKNKYCARITWK